MGARGIPCVRGTEVRPHGLRPDQAEAAVPESLTMNRMVACSVMIAAFLFMPDEHSIVAQVAVGEWTLEQWVGQSAVDGPLHPYVMTSAGRATDAGGAEITLRSTGQGVLEGQYSDGQAVARIEAATVRGRRVTLAGTIEAREASDGASLWMRVNGTAGPLLVDFGGDSRVRGDATNERRSITLPIPLDATTIEFGFRLRGRGTAIVRALKFAVGAALDEGGPPSPEARAVLDAAIDSIKTRALNRDRVTAAVERSVRLLAADAATPADAYPAIRYLIAILADGHSALWSPSGWKMVNSSAPAGAGSQNRDPRVETTGPIGYIEMPGYLGNQPESLRSYAANVHRLLQSSQSNAACRWILDLRNNDGGNVDPMLAALKPFLGDEPLGANMGPDGPTEPRRAGTNVDVEPPSELRELENAWMAVLIGPRTNSAGEAVTLAFLGRARTRLFGQPTSGRTTANAAINLPDGSGLALAVAVMADRTGRVYGGRIEPDELIQEMPGAKAQSDPTAVAARAWLTGRSGCQ